MSYIFGNFFATELLAGISATATQCSIPPSDSLKLPPFTGPDVAQLVFWNGQLPPEIISCTRNDQDGTLYLFRGAEATTPRAWPAGTQIISTMTAEVINTALAAYFDFTVVLNASFLKLIGGTLTGPLVLAADPTLALQAATKQYVDAVQGSKLPLSGGTMSGSINMNSNRLLSLPVPVSVSEPATKQYADDIDVHYSRFLNDTNGSLLTTGTSTAFAIATNTDWSAYTTSIAVVAKFHTDSGLNPTLSLDGLPPLAIHCPLGIPIPYGTIKAFVPVKLNYDSGVFLLHGGVVRDFDWFPGDIKSSIRTGDHGKWLLADGREVNRVGQFGALFTAAGGSWGVGNGSTTFNILDGRGRCLVGADNMGGSAANRVTVAGSGINANGLGNSGGQQNVQLTTSQLPAHNHAVTSFNDPSHNHGVNNGTNIMQISGAVLNPTTAGTGAQAVTITTQGNTTGITFGIGNNGSDAVHTNMPPISIVNFFVRY